MSRWFRHYAGMMRDEKLVRVAVSTKQSVERVTWVWGAILESASEINDGGRFEIDAGEVAYFLRCDDSDVCGILAGLEDIGRVGGGVVSRWSDRQFESDTSRERQRKYRARKTGSQVPEGHGDAGVSASDVTPPSPNAEVTLQETETETERSSEAKASALPVEQKPYPVDPVDRLWAEGVDLMAKMGSGPPKSRPVIGKWIKDFRNHGRILDAIRLAHIEGTRDPIALITRMLKPANGNGKRDDVQTTSDLCFDLAAKFRAEAADGVYPGAGGHDVVLLPRAG